MKTTFLIACGKSKLPRPARAEELYTGALFRKSFRYATLRAAVLEERGTETAIRILSARHLVLKPEQIIGPYEDALVKRSARGRRKWGKDAAWMLEHQIGLRSNFVFLASRLYREAVAPQIEAAGGTWAAPLAHLGIGEQLAWLDMAIAIEEGGTR